MSKVLANEQRFQAVYLKPDAKKWSDRIIFIDPLFKEESSAIVSLKTARLEDCHGLVLAGPNQVLLDFREAMYVADHEDEIGKMTVQDILKRLSKYAQEYDLSSVYVQSGKVSSSVYCNQIETVIEKKNPIWFDRNLSSSITQMEIRDLLEKAILRNLSADESKILRIWAGSLPAFVGTAYFNFVPKNFDAFYQRLSQDRFTVTVSKLSLWSANLPNQPASPNDAVFAVESQDLSFVNVSKWLPERGEVLLAIETTTFEVKEKEYQLGCGWFIKLAPKKQTLASVVRVIPRPLTDEMSRLYEDTINFAEAALSEAALSEAKIQMPGNINPDGKEIWKETVKKVDPLKLPDVNVLDKVKTLYNREALHEGIAPYVLVPADPDALHRKLHEKQHNLENFLQMLEFDLKDKNILNRSTRKWVPEEVKKVGDQVFLGFSQRWKLPWQVDFHRLCQELSRQHHFQFVQPKGPCVKTISPGVILTILPEASVVSFKVSYQCLESEIESVLGPKYMSPLKKFTREWSQSQKVPDFKTFQQTRS